LSELKKGQNQDTWLKIGDILKKAQTIDRDLHSGLDYFQTFEERYKNMMKEQEEGEIFTSAFPAIDNALLGGGLSRGELGSWMGSPGTGKSLALVAAALANMHNGKKVMYISLEMDEDKVAQRFDAQLANLTKHSEVTIGNLIECREIVFQSLRDYVQEYEDKKLMVIKQFPAGTMDVAVFRSYLTQSKMYGFSPDLVILDYVGEMKDYPNMPTWESRNKIVRDLRGIAVEEKICILTAMQPDRRARDQSNEQKHLGIIDDNNLADAYGQSRPIDALWSINQFQEEKDCGLARIFVAKHRHGKSRFTFHVEFDYNTLRMSQISQHSYENKIKEYRNSVDTIAKSNTEKDFKRQSDEAKVDQIIGQETYE
jgi:replicative DNA helicase